MKTKEELKKEMLSKAKIYKKALTEYTKAKKTYEFFILGGVTKTEYVKKEKELKQRQKELVKRQVSKKYEERLRANATESELKFKVKLQQLEITHEFQKTFIVGDEWYIADFYIPEYNMIVELDGGYHTTKEQKSKDRKKNKFYKKLGYVVLRLTNDQGDKISLEDMKDYLKRTKDSYIKSKYRVQRSKIKTNK